MSGGSASNYAQFPNLLQSLGYNNGSENSNSSTTNSLQVGSTNNGGGWGPCQNQSPGQSLVSNHEWINPANNNNGGLGFGEDCFDSLLLNNFPNEFASSTSSSTFIDINANNNNFFPPPPPPSNDFTQYRNGNLNYNNSNNAFQYRYQQQQQYPHPPVGYNPPPPPYSDGMGMMQMPGQGLPFGYQNQNQYQQARPYPTASHNPFLYPTHTPLPPPLPIRQRTLTSAHSGAYYNRNDTKVHNYDEDFSEKLIAFARYNRNVNLIKDILSNEVMPDPRQAVSTIRVERLKEQVAALEKHCNKLALEMKQVEETCVAKKNQLLESSAAFNEKCESLTKLSLIGMKTNLIEDTEEFMQSYTELKKAAEWEQTLTWARQTVCNADVNIDGFEEEIFGSSQL